MTDRGRIAVASVVAVGFVLLAVGCGSSPPRTEPVVRLLYHVNQARAALTATAAAATSLRQLRSYQPRLDAANGPVEEAVQVIRSQLGLPPPDTS